MTKINSFFLLKYFLSKKVKMNKKRKSDLDDLKKEDDWKSKLRDWFAVCESRCDRHIRAVITMIFDSNKSTALDNLESKLDEETKALALSVCKTMNKVSLCGLRKVH